MKIRKTFQGQLPENKIVNAHSTSQTDTYSCDYLNKDKIYSTNEVNTGKYWINGKPIYRKVITGTRTTTPQVIDTIANIEDLVNIYGFVTAIIGGVGYKHNLGGYLGDNFNTGIQIRPNGQIELWSTSTYNNATYKITVEYTKTTDQAS